MSQNSPITTFPAFFWHCVYPYRLQLLIYFTASMVWGANISLLPYQLKIIIDAIAVWSGPHKDVISVIIMPILIYLGLFTLQSILFRVRDWIRLRAIPSIRKNIIMEMFTYLEKHSHQYFQNHFAGSLSNKIMDMNRGVASIITMSDDLFSQIFGIALAIVILWITNPIFTGLFMIWAGLFIIVTYIYTKRTNTLSYAYSQSKSTLSGLIVDSITNIIHVRLFASSDHEEALTDKQSTDYIEKNRTAQWNILKMNLIQTLLTIGLNIGMFYTLILLYQEDKVTAGDFALIITICSSLSQSLWWVMAQMNEFSDEYGNCRQALTIITEPHTILDKKDAIPIAVTKGKVECQNLCFHYENQPNLFERFNLTIEPGQKIGFVGFSGSGKSSFVHLLLRFYDIQDGMILVDDQNIADVTQDSLRQHIAMIPQDPSLFHRTLMENIRYGRLDASDKEVVEASKLANCHEFIMDIPDQYNALVGERGIKLSGGQRQRIAIARAILKNAPILILDEATSALDSVTEKMIQESLDQLMIKRTTIVIAHRLSTLSKMDRLIVLDHGKIIEDGNHEELLKAGGHYAHMWEMQAGGFLPEDEDDNTCN